VHPCACSGNAASDAAHNVAALREGNCGVGGKQVEMDDGRVAADRIGAFCKKLQRFCEIVMQVHPTRTLPRSVREMISALRCLFLSGACLCAVLPS
jgi:hypothetical protein